MSKVYDNARLTTIVDRLVSAPKVRQTEHAIPDLLTIEVNSLSCIPLPAGRLIGVIAYLQLVADVKPADSYAIDIQYEVEGRTITQTVNVNNKLTSLKLDILFDTDGVVKFSQPHSDIASLNATLIYLPNNRVRLS